LGGSVPFAAAIRDWIPDLPVGGSAPSWDTIIIGGGGAAPKESDPNGKSAHEKGSKLDAGKVRLDLVLGGFSRALLEVGKVGTIGAAKYTDGGWVEVPDGIRRYSDAMLRHYHAEIIEGAIDPDTGMLHAAHLAWNALARLDLMIRQLEGMNDEG
jgi:hypothetical protein